MSLKDWEIWAKDETGLAGWKVWNHKEDNDFVEVNKDSKGWWFSNYQSGFPRTKRYFKTKSQAMKYARRYMRRN